MLENGARLKDLIAKLNPSPQASMESIQLFRRSVQVRQKKALDLALRNLETARAALQRKDLATAESALRALVAAEPGLAEAHSLLAQVLGSTGRRDEAMRPRRDSSPRPLARPTSTALPPK